MDLLCATTVVVAIGFTTCFGGEVILWFTNRFGGEAILWFITRSGGEAILWFTTRFGGEVILGFTYVGLYCGVILGLMTPVFGVYITRAFYLFLISYTFFSYSSPLKYSFPILLLS